MEKELLCFFNGDTYYVFFDFISNKNDFRREVVEKSCQLYDGLVKGDLFILYEKIVPGTITSKVSKISDGYELIKYLEKILQSHYLVYTLESVSIGDYNLLLSKYNSLKRDINIKNILDLDI